MDSLFAKDVSVNVNSSVLIRDINLTIKPQELTAILGPNGAGKTTLLRALLGLNKLTSGSVSLGDKDVSTMTPMERAGNISYLPQRRPLAWPNSVRDIVALGRFSHGAAIGRLGPVDQQAVDGALEACALVHLSNRSVDSLSGGEFARVHFARALAANAPLLLADEPIVELDPHHQLKILNLIRQFVDDGGGALVVLHEIALAAQFADRLIWMSDGKIVADGSPEETLTEDRLREIYQVTARVRADGNGFDVRIDSAL